MVITKAQQKEMKEYVVSRLEDSGIYAVRDVDKDCVQIPQGYLFLHSDPKGAENFQARAMGLNREGHNIANIFYKSKDAFFVSLTEDQARALIATTMKNYRSQDVYRMVRLRDKEVSVMDMQRGQRELVYFQPDTTREGGRLNKSLVKFAFRPAVTDYSHIPEDVAGYNHIQEQSGGALKTRMISEKIALLDGKLIFAKTRNPKVLTLDSKKETDLSRDIQAHLVKEFLAQTGTTLEQWGGKPEDVLPYTNPQ